MIIVEDESDSARERGERFYMGKDKIGEKPFSDSRNFALYLYKYYHINSLGFISSVDHINASSLSKVVRSNGFTGLSCPTAPTRVRRVAKCLRHRRR